MIIFRVTTGRSFTKFPSMKDGALSDPLQFATRTAESSFLQSTLNRELRRNQDPDTEQGDARPEDEGTVYITQEKHIRAGEIKAV
jgi:hypothetical protein